MKLTSRIKVTFALTITILSLLVTFAAEQTGVLEFLELQTFDLRMQWNLEDSKASDEIILVLIDEASLQSMKSLVGRWPWPRSLFGDLTEFLAEAGAKAVLFDILYTEPQVPRNSLGELGDDDSRLVGSSAGSGIAIHAAQFVRDTEDQQNKSLLNRPLPPDFIDRYAIKNFKATDEFEAQELNNYYLPIRELYETSLGIGIVEFSPDSDGVFRRTHLLRKYKDDYYPVLAMSLLQNIFQPKSFYFRDNHIHMDNRSIPLQHDGTYLINMKKHYTTFSIGGIFATMQKLQMGDMENLLVNPDDFKDKIVIIGASAAGVEDLKHTALGDNVPGVMLHASIISNILENDFIRSYSPYITYLFTFLISLLITYFILGFHRISVQALGPAILTILFLAIAIAVFDQYRIWIPMAFPIITWSIAFVGSFAYVSATEGKEKRRTRKMLSQYVSPAVLNEVMDRPDGILTAEVGAKEELTILFSDIRGFTTFSEKTPAEQVVEMLNLYLREMVEIVFDYKGTLDKFIGDAVMAFWGAPIRAADHAKKSVYAALKMGEKLDEINQSFKDRDYPEFKIGIGLNTGDVILGNIGSERKLDYTVIGDNVNLASRMEGLTKAYGCDILISESTYNQLEGEIPSRVVDAVRVKGKKLPIKIYSPFIHPDKDKALLEQAKKIVSLTEEAFEMYQGQKWDQSIKIYQELIQINPNDKLAEIFIERCKEYQQDPPPADWDGCYTMKTK